MAGWISPPVLNTQQREDISWILGLNQWFKEKKRSWRLQFKSCSLPPRHTNHWYQTELMGEQILFLKWMSNCNGPELNLVLTQTSNAPPSGCTDWLSSFSITLIIFSRTNVRFLIKLAQTPPLSDWKQGRKDPNELFFFNSRFKPA